MADFNPLPLGSVIGAFLLAFPALFSIVNPIGAALSFSVILTERIKWLVGPPGLEPGTSRLKVACSTD